MITRRRTLATLAAGSAAAAGMAPGTLLAQSVSWTAYTYTPAATIAPAKVFQEIIDSSTRSRPGVNADLGIDPHNPPPLPPHHGPDAEARAHPSPRGGDDAASARGVPKGVSLP